MAHISRSKSCTPCKRRKSYSWMPAILVAILPKCPFCIMAYSGAISMCSGNQLYPNAGGISSYITLGIAALVIVSMILNYKGLKSIVAIGICLSGMVFLAISQFYAMSQEVYYVGVVLIFFGIWYNGSFFHFYNKYIRNKTNDLIKPILKNDS